jgi:hypothetical protein
MFLIKKSCVRLYYTILLVIRPIHNGNVVHKRSLLSIIFIVCLVVIRLKYALSYWNWLNYYFVRHYFSISCRLISVLIRQRYVYCQSLRTIGAGCSLDGEDIQCLLSHLFIGEPKQIQVPKGCVYFVFLYLGNARRRTKFGRQVVLKEMSFGKRVAMQKVIKLLSVLSRDMSWNITIYFHTSLVVIYVTGLPYDK